MLGATLPRRNRRFTGPPYPHSSQLPPHTSSPLVSIPNNTPSPSGSVQSLLSDLWWEEEDQAALSNQVSATMDIFSELRLSSLASTVIPFDGTDASKYPQWKANIQRCRPELSPAGLKSLIFRTLSGPALSLFARETTDPATGEYKKELTEQQLFQTLESSFVPQAGLNQALQELLSLRQRPAESTVAYAERLRALATQAFSQADLATPQRQLDLKQYYIRGLLDSSLQLRLLNDTDLPNFTDVVLAASKYEATVKTVRDIHTVSPVLPPPPTKHVQFQEVASLGDKDELKSALKDIATEVLTPLLNELRVSSDNRRGSFRGRNNYRGRGPTYDYRRRDDSRFHDRRFDQSYYPRNYDRRSYDNRNYYDRYDRRNDANYDRPAAHYDRNFGYNDTRRHSDYYRSPSRERSYSPYPAQPYRRDDSRDRRPRLPPRDDRQSPPRNILTARRSLSRERSTERESRERSPKRRHDDALPEPHSKRASIHLN